jgi:hypothetical protein
LPIQFAAVLMFEPLPPCQIIVANSDRSSNRSRKNVRAFLRIRS